MANRILISGTAPIFIGSCGDDPAGAIVFQVDDDASIEMDVQTRLAGSVDAADAAMALADTAYFNMRVDPRTIVAAGTNISSESIFGVVAPGCDVFLTPSSGTCTVCVKQVAGPLA